MFAHVGPTVGLLGGHWVRLHNFHPQVLVVVGFLEIVHRVASTPELLQHQELEVLLAVRTALQDYPPWQVGLLQAQRYAIEGWVGDVEVYHNRVHGEFLAHPPLAVRRAARYFRQLAHGHRS